MAEALGTPVIGALKNYAGRFDPGNGWLLADGRAVSRTTFASLFAAIVPTIGTFTASGATLTLTAHGLVVGDSVYFTSTTTLPAGLSANTLYYVQSVPTANTFTVSATITSAGPGAAITTTDAGTGTHTAVFCPYGLGNGSTTFNLPDYRGRASLTPAGTSGRLPNSVTALGRSESGEERHTLTAAESGMVQHSHGNTPTNGVTGTGSTGTGNTTATNATSTSAGAHTHGTTVGTGNVSTGHTHQIPTLQVNGTTDGATGNTAHTNCDSANPANYASQANAGGHSHGTAAASTGNEDTQHSHSFSVPAQTIPAQGVPALSITTQAAAPAASAHNNIPPGVGLNKIIRTL